MIPSPGKIISRIYWCTQAYMEQKLYDYGIGSGEVVILMTLYHKNSMKQKEIAEKIHINKATVSREIEKLIKSGYVRRRRDGESRRGYIITLTEKGESIVPEIKEILLEWKKILMHGFSMRERGYIMRALEKMEKNAIRAVKGGKSWKD